MPTGLTETIIAWKSKGLSNGKYKFLLQQIIFFLQNVNGIIQI